MPLCRGRCVSATKSRIPAERAKILDDPARILVGAAQADQDTIDELVLGAVDIRRNNIARFVRKLLMYDVAWRYSYV